jgi:uncharacterized protein YbaR (Trm112 family)
MSSHSFDLEGRFRCCPKSRSALVADGDTLVCVDPDCRLQFDIQDGIPVMLPDEARVLSREDWQSIMDRTGNSSHEE